MESKLPVTTAELKALKKRNKLKVPLSTRVFHVLGFTFIITLSILCLLPFLMILSGSLSEESSIIKNGYSLWPESFTLDAYRAVFQYPEQILKAYGITIFVTAFGTGLGLFFISMGGYVLARKDFKYRNHVAFLIYFTTLFSGGLIPWYIVLTEFLHLKNSVWGLILPSLMNPFLIFLYRNYLLSIPDSLVESARMDGANDFLIYRKIILPLAKPALATIGLFLALGYWNDWFLSSILMTDPDKYSLQYLLYQILQNAQFFQQQTAAGIHAGTVSMPTESIKLATAIIATGPVILFYPFAQKYFVQGLTIGGVKG
ncbi:carbohydrate ABC transporter permease [Bacillus sp. NPDC077027]|uniref:carbohydrate ABC transporter permease n=1 Tax=Bacillus sp. NPDC077027 TaxID=3390548 RepID=UPI003CFC5839